MRPIVLLTDFGLKDWYVGAMKGEILKRAPGATILDLCHLIEPQNVRSAAFQLWCALASMPADALFCCVVDPGVGTDRRSLCGRIGSWMFCGPDNGLLTPLARRAGGDMELYTIEHPDFRNPTVSATFHGRDLFAPAAARLALGVDPAMAGPRVHDPMLFGDLLPEEHGGVLVARVMMIDHFGNLVTNVDRERYGGLLESAVEIRVGRLTVRQMGVTFGSVERGDAVAYWGSAGTLEIGINQGSAAQRSQLPVDGVVEIIPRGLNGGSGI